MSPDLQSHLVQGISGSRSGLALFDADDRLRWANPWFRAAYGIAEGTEPSWTDLLRHRHQDGTEAYRGAATRSFESDLADGRWLWVTECVGDNGWVTVYCTDISALKAHEATLRKARDEAVAATRTDLLTGLANRRAVLRRLHDELEHAHAMRLPLCVALIDVDHFKRINDFHGHDAGDRVLTSLARTLKRHRRRVDVFGRFGGGEFLLMLPNATLDGAQATLQRLRVDVEASLATVRRGELAVDPFDFSAGITQARYGDTVDSLVQRADAALSQAKRDGRGCDRVIVPEPDDTFGWSDSTQSAALAR